MARRKSLRSRPSHFWTVIATAFAVLALGVGIAGAAGTSSLKSKLLTVSQLPSGWAVNNSAIPPTTSSCYSNPLWKVPVLTRASVDFDQGGSLPALIEQAGTYRSGKAAFEAITKRLNNCRRFKESSGSVTVKGSIGPLSFAKHGQESRAYLAQLTVKGEHFSQAFVVTREGNVVLAVALSDFPPLDLTSLAHFTTLATARFAPAAVATVAPTAPSTTTARLAPPPTTTAPPAPPPTTAPPAPPPTTSPPASCHPTTASGNCYEPGELCSNADHGVTGLAGNGETITCEDNNGWRWEPT